MDVSTYMILETVVFLKYIIPQFFYANHIDIAPRKNLIKLKYLKGRILR